MSKAEELLASLTEPAAMAYGISPATEPHIVINSDKTITVPEELKHIAVQGDHNIETVTFDCPRYWDEHDLSAMSVRLIYQRPDGHREKYPVKNLRVDETDTGIIHFDWTISRNVTLLNGGLSIQACALTPNAEGEGDPEWHSRINRDLVIDEGMDSSDDYIVEQNPDVVESILIRLDRLESSGGVTDEQVANAVSNYMEKHPVSGLSAAEKNLMLALFKAVPYTGEVAQAYKSLEAIWNSGSGGGGDDVPDTPDIPEITYHTITYNLTAVTADNYASSVIAGGSLTVNLTTDTNAVLGEVAVTMGGVDVTATAYKNGKISIASVTGDVVITAAASMANYTQVEYLEAAASDAHIFVPKALGTSETVECVWSGGTGWIFPFGAFGNGVHCSLVTRLDATAGRTAYTRRAGASYVNRTTADPSFAMPTDKNAIYRFTESAPGTGTIYDADNNAMVTLTDDQVSSYSGSGVNVALFHIANGGNLYNKEVPVGLRIHRFKIVDAYGTSVCDLIPVVDKDGIPCMYEKVSGTFVYDSSGNNAFIAGGAV